jgi:hypothetical protein
MMKRRNDRPARRPASIVPKDRSGDLPPWAVPAGLDTPASAWAAALDYGAAATPLAPRSTAKAAYRALLAARPDLRRLDIRSRLDGTDPTRPRPAPVYTLDDVESLDDVTPPPF